MKAFYVLWSCKFCVIYVVSFFLGVHPFLFLFPSLPFASGSSLILECFLFVCVNCFVLCFCVLFRSLCLLEWCLTMFLPFLFLFPSLLFASVSSCFFGRFTSCLCLCELFCVVSCFVFYACWDDVWQCFRSLCFVCCPYLLSSCLFLSSFQFWSFSMPWSTHFLFNYDNQSFAIICWCFLAHEFFIFTSFSLSIRRLLSKRENFDEIPF